MIKVKNNSIILYFLATTVCLSSAKISIQYCVQLFPQGSKKERRASSILKCQGSNGPKFWKQ